jgi:hypothetical protein
VSYLDELARELAAVGIRGSRRRRILIEAEDHLRESGDPVAFGDPALVAQRFADELATVSTRRAAFGTFLALAPAGIGYAALFAFQRGPDITSARHLPLGLAAAMVMVLAPQVAFASGALALLRGWRLRAADVAPAAELRILRRRAGVAVASGIATLLAIALYAYEYSAGLSTPWLVAAAAVSGGALVPLAFAAVAVGRAASLRPTTPGDVGDLLDDLKPLVDRLPPQVRVTPWRLCLALAVLVAAAALSGGGPDEGPRNALAEVLAIFGGYAALGRYLGLRESRARH